MALRQKRISAKFSQVLMYIDGPQLILLETTTTTYVVAVAINRDGYQYPFLAVELSREHFGDYLSEKNDLRYVFTNPTYRRWYVFEYGEIASGWAALNSTVLSQDEMEALMPGHGLFARDHTEPMDGRVAGAQSRHQFNIDGSWDLVEFSRFYNQITDLYAMFNGAQTYANDNAPMIERRKVQEAFIKPWQGGGSYGSFYDSMEAAQDRSERLRVGGIKYNSPGYIEVRGREGPFEDIYKLMDNLRTAPEYLAKGYGDLRRFLADNRLLSLAADRFDRQSDLAEEVAERARVYAEILDVIPYDQLFRMAGHDPLIVAKVLLSIYRRAVKLNEFILEGRVTLPVNS